MELFPSAGRIIIIDDNPIIFEGIRSVFKNSSIPQNLIYFESILTAKSNLEDGMNQDLLLLDLYFVNHPVEETITFCAEAKKSKPYLKIISMSSQLKPFLISKLMSVGANGFFLKTDDLIELLEGIKTVLEGGEFYSKTIRENYKEILAFSESNSGVSEREISIIKLISEGLATTEIGDKLFISPYTVENHRANILRKLKANNSSELIKIALSKGLI